jgi:hypothetical protein
VTDSTTDPSEARVLRPRASARAPHRYPELVLAQACALARRAHDDNHRGRDARDRLLLYAAHAANRYLDLRGRWPVVDAHHPQLGTLATVLRARAASMTAGADRVRRVVARLDALGLGATSIAAPAAPAVDARIEQRLISQGLRRVQASLRRAIGAGPRDRSAFARYGRGAAAASQDLIVVADAVDAIEPGPRLRRVRARFGAAVGRLHTTIGALDARVRASAIEPSPRLGELYWQQTRILIRFCGA